MVIDINIKNRVVLTAHSSQLTAHSSQLTAHSSQALLYLTPNISITFIKKITKFYKAFSYAFDNSEIISPNNYAENCDGAHDHCDNLRNLKGFLFNKLYFKNFKLRR